MNQIKLNSWIVGALILIGLGLIVDYYFIHILFQEKQQALKHNQTEMMTTEPPLPPPPQELPPGEPGP